MLLRDLPDDILRLVLEASLDSRPKVMGTLKPNLPLLAVCRRWRYLALASVHSGVAIHYGKPGYGSDSGDEHASGAADEPDDAEITTNLGLVVAAGCVQTVKRVEIVVNHRANPFPGFGAVTRLMRAAAEEWRGVRELAISTFPTDQVLSRRLGMADHEAGIKQTSATLAAIMPGTCRVFFKDYYANSVVQKLYGQLAVLYSDRLGSLASFRPIIVPPDHTFRQLRKLSIWHDDSTSYQHPRVDSANLESLELVLWPTNHSWAPFSAGNDTGAIEFPSLKSLKAIYKFTNEADGPEAWHRGGRPWRLHFPKLDKLNVRCKPDACPLLECAVLPPRMSEICIDATAPVLVRLAEIRLPTTQSLKITVSTHSNGNPAALAAANRILKGAQESTERALYVKDSLVPVLPKSIGCTSLTELSIWSGASVDTMLELIRMLPGLVKLSIWCLDLSNIQEDISVPGPEEACLARPLGSKIEEITIYTSANDLTLEMLMPVAKYLLLRIPTLARFYSVHLPRMPIAGFVNAYSKRYPHLAAIEYRLRSDN